MPGIAFHRFVDATELKAEFTCSLCHLVLAHPLMASCCKTVFCDACIRPYVQSKKSCPADKKPLSVENNNNGNSSPRGGHRSSPSTSNGGNGSLVRPSSSLLRQLNCLKVKCTYAEVGCREVLPLETMLEVHEKQCTYGQAQVCPYCSFAVIQLTAAPNDEQQQQQQQQQQEQQQQEPQDHQQQQEQQTDQQPPPPPQPQSVHVCQQSVAEYRESTGKELEEAAALLASLRLQLANYNRTVHELKLERTRAQNEASSHNNGGENSTGKPTVMNLERVVSNKELLTEARKYVNSAAVDGQKTAKEMVAKVVGLVKEALITRGDNIHAVARFIKEAMDCHYVGDWNVNLLWNNLGFAYYNFCPESYVEAKFGRVSIVVYKSFKSVSKKGFFITVPKLPLSLFSWASTEW